MQNIYDGGKLTAAMRRRAHQEAGRCAIPDLHGGHAAGTRVAYYDVLLAAQQITVHEASVNLLQKEREDQQRRYDAGTVPHFNVLRAEVAVANERPALIQRRNNYRIAKNNLSNLLGYNLPRDIWEDIPLRLTDTLGRRAVQPQSARRHSAGAGRRTELTALRKAEELQQLGIVNAKSGYKPTVQVFAGYNWLNSSIQHGSGHFTGRLECRSTDELEHF